MIKYVKLFLLALFLTQNLYAQNTANVNNLQLIDSLITKNENRFKKVVPVNKSKILWSPFYKHKKSPIAFVYLHGFGASHREGEPIMSMLSARFKANVFLSRLAGHGMQDASGYQTLTPKKYLESAKKAVEIGKKIGDTVIVVSTSTGGTLGLKLASEDSDIKALILYSPFIDVIDKKTLGLLTPKGKAFMTKQNGGEIIEQQRPPEQIPYWSTKYHINGYVALLQLVKSTMTKATFKKVQCPVFLGYYYKDEEHQDKVVSVKAMQKMFPLLGTFKKTQIAFPKAGNHVIGCDLRSKDWKSVYEQTQLFIETKILNR